MSEQERVLLTSEGYEGKYVALRSLLDRTVAACGDDPKIVMEQARRKGLTEPVIFFVPEHDISLVY